MSWRRRTDRNSQWSINWISTALAFFLLKLLNFCIFCPDRNTRLFILIHFLEILLKFDDTLWKLDWCYKSTFLPLASLHPNEKMLKRHLKSTSQEYIFFAENFCTKSKKKTKKKPQKKTLWGEKRKEKGLHMTIQA